MRKVNIFTKKGGIVLYNNELKHYGIQGMKWGVRRYQNKDGSLTPAGQAHYRSGITRSYSFRSGLNQKLAKAARTRGLNKQAGKFKKKAEMYEQKAKYSQELDNKTAIAKGKNKTKSLLMSGLVGFATYNAYVRSREAGVAKGKAIADVMLTGGLGSNNEYIKSRMAGN